MPEVPSQVQSKLLPSKFMIHEVSKWLFEIGDFPGGADGKESACSARDQGSIPGSGRPPGEGNAYPFQYSCLENPMNRGVWQAIVPGVPKNWM